MDLKKENFVFFNETTMSIRNFLWTPGIHGD